MSQRFSLEEMLYQFQDNEDEYAFAYLLNEFLPQIKKYSTLSFANQEDCQQYLTICFWQALHKIRLDYR